MTLSTVNTTYAVYTVLGVMSSIHSTYMGQFPQPQQNCAPICDFEVLGDRIKESPMDPRILPFYSWTIQPWQHQDLLDSNYLVAF